MTLAPPATRPTEVTVARTVADVERLRSLWCGLEVSNIDSDIDYFLAVVQSEPQAIGPYVVRVRDATGDRLVVSRLVRYRVAARLGYRDVRLATVTAALVSFDGILGCHTRADLRPVVGALDEQLHHDRVDLMVFQKRTPDDDLHEVLRSSVPRIRRAAQSPVVSYRLDTPSSLDELLAGRSSKSRQRIRRERSVFNRDHAGRWAIRRWETPADLARLEQDLEAVTRSTYQHGLALGSVGDPVLKQVRRLGIERGWLRSWLLYLDDRPVAFWWGIAYRGTLTPGTTGYDPQLHDAGAGTFTLLQLLEDMCADPEISAIDFGFGEAEYKRRFSSGSTSRSDVVMFGTGPRSLLAWAGQVVNNALADLAGFAGAHTGLVTTLKRRWRAAGRRSASDG